MCYRGSDGHSLGHFYIYIYLKKTGTFVGRPWTGFTWLRIQPIAGYYMHGNEPSYSIK
jgi:hypothetical protein